ncbi:MAG: cyclic nucleotide-binding domain-containing protein [Kofleriaceae bacterium]
MTTSLRELEKRLAREPDNLPLRVTVAGMLRESGRAAEAVEHYRRVALAYRALGRQQQSIAVCRSILELAPTDIAIHALLAELTEPKTPVPAVAVQQPAAGEGTNTKVRAAPRDDVDVEFSDPGLQVDDPTRDPRRDDDVAVPHDDDDDDTRPPPATGSRPPVSAFARVPSPAGTRGAGSPTSPPPLDELRARTGSTPPSPPRPAQPAQPALPHVPKLDARTPAMGAPRSPAPSAPPPVGRPALPPSSPPVGRPVPGASSPKSSPPVGRSAVGSSSPKSSPPVVRIPPKTKSIPPAAALAPAPPIVPPQRPSFEIDTPLPRPIPYHIADPTSAQMKLAREEAERGAHHEAHHESVDEALETRPGDPKPAQVATRVATPVHKRLKPETDTTGLAQAARRISGLISPLTSAASKDLDLAAELDTRQRPRLSAEDLARVHEPPPTVPTEQVVLDDELPTPLPRVAGWTKGPPIRDTPIDPPTDLRAALPNRDTQLDVVREEAQTNPVDLLGADPVANVFFTTLPPNRRAAALARCMRRDTRAGNIVIRQGETAHALILVVTGQLEVRVERANGSIVVLDTIQPGHYIGEAALLGRTPAQASVIALTDGELLALPPHALFELAGAFPALWAALKDTAERRTRLYEKLIRA